MSDNTPISELLEKIAKECREATASEWDITKIIKALSTEKTQNINELREKATKILEQTNPQAAKIYCSFNQLKVITSKNTIEPFDRGNIIKSLVKETSTNRTIAEKIGHEVEDKIKDLKINNLTTSLIREMVNAKLLEYGHESVRNQYARLGLPVFEVEKKTGNGFFYSRQIMEEYNLLKIIPQKIAMQHFESEIFIEDIAGFSTKCISYCETGIESEKPQNAILELMAKAGRIQKFFTKPVSFFAPNFSFTGEIKNAGREEKEFLENFSKAAGLMEKNLFGIPLFVPEKFEKSKNREIAKKTGIKLCQMQKPNFAIEIDSKYQLKLLEEKIFENDFLIINCGKRELLPLNRNFCSKKKALITATAVNLPKIAGKNARKESSFFRELNEKIESAKELHSLKAGLLKKQNYWKQNNIAIEEHCSAIEFYAIEKACKIFLETPGEKECFEFAEKIAANSLKQIDEMPIELCEARSKNAIERFEKNPDEKTVWRNKKLIKGFLKKEKAETKSELNELIDEGTELIQFNGKKTD